MTSRGTRHEESYSSSNVVRTLHPSRPLSPPQKNVEFNNNNLGKSLNLCAALFAYSTDYPISIYINSSKITTFLHVHILFHLMTTPCLILFHWLKLLFGWIQKKNPTNIHIHIHLIVDTVSTFDFQASSLIRSLGIRALELHTHFPKGYSTRCFFSLLMALNKYK